MVTNILKYGILILLGLAIIGAFVPQKEDKSNNQQQEQSQTVESSATSDKDLETTDSGNQSTTDSQTAETTQSDSIVKTSEETYVKVDGMHAIQEYGDSYFPYGWNLHDIMGVISIQPQSDGSWFIKCECDVKNAYGTKIDGICEATIVGSGENWTVTGFNVYEV